MTKQNTPTATATLTLGDNKTTDVEVTFLSHLICTVGAVSWECPGRSRLSFVLPDALPNAARETYFLCFDDETIVLFVTFQVIELDNGFRHTIVYPQ